MKIMEYLVLREDAIDRALFAHFRRRQEVTKCWRKEEGRWCVKDAPFIDDWSQEDYGKLVRDLKHTVRTGGMVAGGFDRQQLKGFVSVEPERFGAGGEYLDLSSLHVSEEMRGQGMGTKLFELAKDWARTKGARKLYISAHSAVESQAFYRAMGCVEAMEYHRMHVEKEPYDCQLECSL